MPTKTITSTLSLTLSSMLFSAVPAMAEYSPWMKISKIESYGRVLAKRKLIPVKIQCKRGPGRVYWRNTLLRLKLAPTTRKRITGWEVSITQAYEGGRGMSRQAKSDYHHRLIVPPGSSGISALCGIIHYTKSKVRARRSRRLF